MPHDSSEAPDTGVLAEVPPNERADVDEPVDNALRGSDTDDVTDVPVGTPAWVDPGTARGGAR